MTAMVRRLGVAALVLASVAAVGGAVWYRGRAAVEVGDLQRGSAHRADAPGAKERIATVENSLRALEEAERTAPRDRWDPSYVVGVVGSDPQALRAWVRDNTTWIPYQGMLRGAQGVLLDRRGNSLDRAILLGRLVEAAGHQVRLVNVTLDDEAAVRAVISAPSSSTALVPEPRGASFDAVGRAAARYQLNPAAVVERLQANDRAVSRLASAMDARVADQTSRLLRSGVRGSGAKAEWNVRFQRAVAARRDHWSVQVESAGTWVDLDVDAALTGPPDSRHPRRIVRLDGLEAAVPRHQITVRVIAERWLHGAVTTRPEMEHVLVPADLLGQPIVLQFMPESAFRGQKVPLADGEFAAVANDERVWMVSLAVGSDVVASGMIENTASGGGAFGGFGAALSRMGGSDEPVLSAVWLEYEMAVPGEPTQVIRRTVFDLVGPAARTATPVAFALDGQKRMERALAMTMRTELLPIACAMPRAFVTHLVSRYAVENRRLLTLAAAHFGAAPDAELLDTFDSAAPMVTPLYALALARLEWSGDASRVFVARPGLLTRHSYFGRDGNETVIKSATDIVANGLGVSLSVGDAFRLRLLHGVLDTNAEAFLHSSKPAVDNTGSAFAVDRPWVALRPDQAAAVDRLQLDADVRQRIRADLAAGFAVVAPRSAVPSEPRPFSGWWRIDPSSGDSLGMAANGWGQAAEDMAITRRNVAVSQTLRKMGARFAHVFIVAAGSCYVINGAHEIEQSGVILGIKTVFARDSGQCVGEGVFWGSLATLPLVALTVNLRFGSMAQFEAGAAAEGTAGNAAAEGAAGEGTTAEGAAGESASGSGGAPAPGETAGPPADVPPPGEGANPSGNEPSRSAASVPPPAPRGLPEIAADIEAADQEAAAANAKLDQLNREYWDQVKEAKDRGQRRPELSDAQRDAFLDKTNKMDKQADLRREYEAKNGMIGPDGKPAGPKPPNPGWFEVGPHAGDLGISPGQPAPGGAGPSGGGGGQGTAPAGPPAAAPHPDANPFANTVPVGGPVHAPVRGGPPNLPTDQTVFAGAGGLFGIK